MIYDWDDSNTEHIGKHGVETDEAEEAIEDPDRQPVRAYRGATGETRRAIIGATNSGRLLVVVFSWRRTALRVVTARDATDREKRLYRRK